MADEKGVAETTDNGIGVNGNSESQEVVTQPYVDDTVPGSDNILKNEINEAENVEDDPPILPSPRLGIRVKRELLAFDGNTAESESLEEQVDDPEPEQEDSSVNMVQFPNMWVCPTCGSVCSSPQELQIHQATCHFPVTRPHVCTVCQECFERKTDLNNHLVCHQTNRPHACRMCGNLHRTKAELMSHMLTHQTDKPHKCSTCGQEFQRHSSLTNHMKIHSYAAGRALIPSIFPPNKINNPLIPLASSPSTSGARKNPPTWQPERSTEPIPSFETLPAPGYSYYNNLASTTNYTAFLANKVTNNGGLIPNKNTDEEISSVIQPPINSQTSFASSTPATQITCLPDISQSIDEDTPGDLPADFPLSQQNFNVPDQSQFDNVQEEESNQPDNNELNPYLSVKNCGLMYGIKVEDQYNQEQNTQQQSPEELTSMGDPQSDDTFMQHMSDSPDSEMASSPPGADKAVKDMPVDGANKPHMCHFCGIYFARQKAYQSHMRLHDDNWEPTYQCQVCSEQFPDYVALSLHSTKCMRGASRDEDFNLNNLRQLPVVVNGQNIPAKPNVMNKQFFKHECDNCGKRFATKQKLFRHMWIHRKKLFTCETCGKVFEERELLDKHRIELHPPNDSTPYACQVCGKSFTSRQTLWEHGRVHGGTAAGAALLWCQECNKSFASRQGYQIHTRTHTGERPYGCRYCMKSFRDGGTLRKHERIHTGERPHACPLCMKTFNQKVVLREHVRWLHAAPTKGDPPHSCLLCGASVPDREALCAHIVKHSDDMASEARASTKTPNDTKSRRPPRKTNKVLVQAVDGKFVAVEQDQLERLSTVAKPTKRTRPTKPTSTITKPNKIEFSEDETTDDSSQSNPTSPFKVEPSTSNVVNCDNFGYSSNSANSIQKVPPSSEKGTSDDDDMEGRVRIPSFSEISQSARLEEPAPNVSIADVPDTQVFLNQDASIPDASLQSETMFVRDGDD